MQGVGKRLKARARDLGYSDAEVARRAGLSTRAYGYYATDEREPDFATLMKICGVLQTTPNELFDLSVGDQDGFSAPRLEDDGQDTGAVVWELDVRAAAGPNGTFFDITTENEAEARRFPYRFPTEGFTVLYGAAPDRVRILEVFGDSMAPDYMPGQKVMVDVQDRSPSPPGVFIIWDGVGIVIKRIEFLIHSDPPIVKIKSANPAYETYERTVGEAHILGRVIGKWQRT